MEYKHPVSVQVSELIDALPYIDKEYERRKREVDRLIIDEMKTFSPPDYLENLPPPPEPFTNNELLRKEYERVAKKQKMQQIDTSRYQLLPPENGTVDDWLNAIHNAEAQLQHQDIRLTNLELLNMYAQNKWVSQIQHLQLKKQRGEFELDKIKKETEEVNRSRKEKQVGAAQLLNQLNEQWFDLVMRSKEVDLACEELQNQINKKTVNH